MGNIISTCLGVSTFEAPVLPRSEILMIMPLRERQKAQAQMGSKLYLNLIQASQCQMLIALQLWLAPVEDSRAESYQLLYDPFIKQANFFRELLAIAWYWYQGWLC